MFCTNCGREISDDARFCTECGHPVRRWAPAEAPAVEELSTAEPPAEESSAAELSLEKPAAEESVAASSSKEPSADETLAEEPVPDETRAEEPLSEDSTSPSESPSDGFAADKTTVLPDSSNKSPSVSVSPTEPMPSVGEPAVKAKIVPEEKESSARPDDKKKKRVIIAFVAIIVVIAVGIGAWAILSRMAHERAVAEAVHQIQVTVTAEGWDTGDGASRIPISATGEDALGNEVDKTFYVSSDGEGLELSNGTYELSIDASPIAVDGTIYTVPEDHETLAVAEESEDSSRVDATGSISFGLDPVPALEVTDDQISSAYDAASNDDAADADALKDAAVKRRDDAVAAKKKEEEERKAREARHVVTDEFEFWLPEYWDGRVTVKVGEPMEYEPGFLYTVDVVSKKFPDCTVMTLWYSNTVSPQIGGPTLCDAGVKSISSDEKIYGFASEMASPAFSDDIDYDLSYTYDPQAEEKAEELLDLQTGGAVKYSEAVKPLLNGEIDPNDWLEQNVYAPMRSFLTPVTESAQAR